MSKFEKLKNHLFEKSMRPIEMYGISAVIATVLGYCYKKRDDSPQESAVQGPSYNKVEAAEYDGRTTVSPTHEREL